MSLMTDRTRPAAEAHASTSHWAVPILLVDDNAAKRMTLKAVLAPLGYFVVEADSGAAGLRCVMANDFAVILLDVRMPIMDGFETAALIRLRQQSEITPIIFVTAHQTDVILTDRYAEGAVDFITTPVHPDELRAKVSVFANLFLQSQAIAAKARELQSSADQLRLLTEAAPIGIFQTDAHNRYIYTNARWTEITGIPTAAAAGQEWHVIIDDEQLARIAADHHDSHLGGAEFSSRLEIRTPGSASRIVLLTSKSMIDEDGGITGWVGTLADITAEAGAEAAMAAARDEATAASRLKSDFLANMSHEIRTPMTGVIGITELLLETDLDVQQREFANTLRNSGDALMTVINDILDFSKIETGMLEVEDIEFSVQTVVDDVVDLLARSARTKGLELKALIEGSVPAVVSGDPSRLRQVLTNLTGNAIKFTHAGEVLIRVTAAEVDGSETVVRFELADTGVGIAPDKLAMIFEPFTQADTSTTREYGGTGLGLAISSQLVALMGGDVGISSQLGAGSTFWFTIRVHAVAAEATPGWSSPDAELAGVRTLIVDDSATRLSILSDYLVRWGMSVETAPSPGAALALLHAAADRGRPIAIALVDRSLDLLEGVSLGTAIAADPVLTTHLVLMTEQRDFGDMTGLGWSASLSKPIHREDLRTCLRDALGPQPAAIDVTAMSAGFSPGQLESGRLLLAEDNVMHQRVAVAILSTAGYQVDTVRNGAEAVRAAASQRYDAILMDCQMPQMDGYEATAAIRDQEGSSRHTPIIALLAGASGEDRDRFLEGGMDEYVSKPIRREPLLDMIRQSVRPAQDVNSPLPLERQTTASEPTLDSVRPAE